MTGLPRIVALLLVVALAACGGSEAKGRWVGKRPPAYSTVDATWLNSPTGSVFDGKVLFLEFGFLR